MGFKWKRLSEKAKQILHLHGNQKDWKPTSNARNEAMIEDARKFSKQLRALYKDLELLEGKIDGSFGVMKGVLNSHLPRVYATSTEGLAVPVDTDAGAIIGTGVNFAVIDEAANHTKNKLRNEVLHPLDQWLNAYRTIKQRNKKCEAVRLELDGKRRLATKMHVGYEKQKTKVAQHAEKAVEATVKTGDTSKLEQAEYKLQTEEDKAARLTQRFKDIEQEVFLALLTLIKDTAVLRQYAAAALVVMEGCFQQAYAAFDLSVPLAATHSVEGTTAYVKPVEPHLNPDGTLASSPNTPDKVPIGAVPSQTTPAWYHEARNNAQAQNYDSEDEH